MSFTETDRLLISRVHPDARELVTGIILAGGKSERMGADKSLLPFLGRPLIQHIHGQLRPYFSEILVAGDSVERYAFLEARLVSDEVPGQGPLRGIVSALAASQNDLNFVIACDIPWVDHALLKILLREAHGCDCVVPVTLEGYYEPLFAVYRKSALPAMRRALEAGQRRVVAAFSDCRVRTVVVPDRKWLDNINTPDDYERAIRCAESDAWKDTGTRLRNCSTAAPGCAVLH